MASLQQLVDDELAGLDDLQKTQPLLPEDDPSQAHIGRPGTEGDERSTTGSSQLADAPSHGGESLYSHGYAAGYITPRPPPSACFVSGASTGMSGVESQEILPSMQLRVPTILPPGMEPITGPACQETTSQVLAAKLKSQIAAMETARNEENSPALPREYSSPAAAALAATVEASSASIQSWKAQWAALDEAKKKRHRIVGSLHAELSELEEVVSQARCQMASASPGTSMTRVPSVSAQPASPAASPFAPMPPGSPARPPSFVAHRPPSFVPLQASPMVQAGPEMPVKPGPPLQVPMTFLEAPTSHPGVAQGAVPAVAQRASSVPHMRGGGFAAVGLQPTALADSQARGLFTPAARDLTRRLRSRPNAQALTPPRPRPMVSL